LLFTYYIFNVILSLDTFDANGFLVRGDFGLVNQNTNRRWYYE